MNGKNKNFNFKKVKKKMIFTKKNTKKCLI